MKPQKDGLQVHGKTYSMFYSPNGSKLGAEFKNRSPRESKDFEKRSLSSRAGERIDIRFAKNNQKLETAVGTSMADIGSGATPTTLLLKPNQS